ALARGAKSMTLAGSSRGSSACCAPRKGAAPNRVTNWRMACRRSSGFMKLSITCQSRPQTQLLRGLSSRAALENDFAVHDRRQRLDVFDLVHRAGEKILRDHDHVGQL